MMASCHFYSLLIFIAGVSANTAPPTVVNTTGEYYIASNNNDLSFMNISCSSTDCYIFCHQKNGCMHTIINASHSASLTIECAADEFSCSRLQLIHSATDMTTIKCLDAYGCSHVNLQTHPSRYVIIECATKHTCFFATIKAKSATLFQLLCNNRKSCFKSNISANNARSVTITASSHHSIYGTNIDASNVTSLNVAAIHNAAIYRVRIHVPCNGFNLSCGAYGCLNASYIYVTESLTNASVLYDGICYDEYDDDYVPLDINHILSNVSIYCNGSEIEHCDDANSVNDTCGCDILWNGLRDSYAAHCPAAENKKAVFQLSMAALLGVMFAFLCLIVTALWWIVLRNESQKETMNPVLLTDSNANNESSPYIAPIMSTEDTRTEMVSGRDNEPDVAT